MLEPGVMRNIWLLFESLQQSDLSFGPFVEQTKVRAGATAHVNTGKVENQRITKQRILRGNAEGKTCLAICIAGLVIILFVAVARGLAGRTRRDHVHEFESGIDDVHASRIRTRSFDINAHHRVDVTAGKVGVTPIRLFVIRQTSVLRGFRRVSGTASGSEGAIVEHLRASRTRHPAQIRA